MNIQIQIINAHMIFASQGSKTALRENVRLIASARLALWCVAQLFLLLDYLFLNLQFNFILAELILSLFAFSAMISFAQLKRSRTITEAYIRAQLVSDVVFMSMLFHVTGGSANPFVSLLLFPLTISAATLSVRFTWFMVLLTLSCYGSLYLFSLTSLEHYLPNLALNTGATDNSHAQHMHHQSSEDQSAFSLHLIGMWFNFALSASLISYFIIRMRQELNIQQSKINEQREQLLRDEQLLGIATQAASAAHHMSTPLSTMAVLVEDLQTETHDEDFQEDLQLLASQIGSCKHVLDDLRHQARLSQQAESVEHFISQLTDEFRLLRPGVKLEQGWHDTLESKHEAHSISSDPSLRMAILNILNNAADASPHRVTLQAGLEQNKLKLTITDYGKSDENKVSRILSAAEQPLESDKEHGMGIGLFLSHATINRHQGQISVEAGDKIGTRVHISLTLSAPIISGT